jgi:hypothetical protein
VEWVEERAVDIAQQAFETQAAEEGAAADNLHGFFGSEDGGTRGNRLSDVDGIGSLVDRRKVVVGVYVAMERKPGKCILLLPPLPSHDPHLP